MIFLTKGEFIQALKDYNQYIEMSESLQNEYRDLYYLRYQRVRSPLDYDIVGYEHGEAVRQLKSRGSYNQQTISESQEKLEERMVECVDRNSELQTKINNVNDELKQIEEPLRSILEYRYKDNRKLKDVCNRFKDMYLDESGMYRYIMRELQRYYE